MKKLFFVLAAIVTGIFASAQDAAQMINDANEALKVKDYAKAFQLYDAAMKNIGEVQIDPSINFNIGFAALQADKLAECLPYFDKAIEAGANVSKSHEYKATAFARLNEFAKAIESYTKAIEATEENPGNLYFNAAISAYKGNLFEDAIRLFSEAEKAGYKPGDALYYRAASLKKMDRDEEYKQTLIEGVEKYSGEKRLAASLSIVYVNEGNQLYRKGVEILNAANEKVNAQTLTTTDPAYAAEVEKSKVEFKKALEVLQKAIVLDPANANAQKLIDACKQVI